jgi:hypothetical protein
MKCLRTGSVLVVLTMATLAAAGVGPAAAGLTARLAIGSSRWRAVATISVPSHSTVMFAVASAEPIPRWTWAVGGTAQTRTGKIRPLVENWTGSRWSRLTLPSAAVSALGPDPLLVTAAAFRVNQLWAFTPSGGWLTGSGSTWTAGRFRSARRLLIQASITGTDEGTWAFGGIKAAGGFVPYATVSLRLNRWKRVPVPGKGVIVSASVNQAFGNDIWAVLGEGVAPLPAKAPGLVHWDGLRWHAVRLPRGLRTATLSSVLVRGMGVWVGGGVKNRRHGTTEVVGHWNGHRWRVITLRAAATSAPFRVTSMVNDGTGGIWALGTCFASRCPNGTSSRLWHEVAGRWSGPIEPKLASKPTVLLGLADQRHSVWGAGAVIVTKTRANGLIALWRPAPPS